MKKVISLLVIVTSFVFAGDSEDFYYERGLEAGFQRGLIKGQEIAFNDAKKILEAYKNRIRAYELGKYLIEKKMLTAPEVYQQVDKDGSIKFVVLPSKIVKQLDIESIFAEFKELPTLQSNMLKNKKSKLDVDSINSVHLSSRDNNMNMLPDKSSRDGKKSALKVKKTRSNRNLLNGANVVYVEHKNSYEVVFFTHEEKRDFCSQFKVLCK